MTVKADIGRVTDNSINPRGVLHLRATSEQVLWPALGLLAMAAWTLVKADWGRGPIGIFDWIVIGFCSFVGLAFGISALMPVELRADVHGIRYRALWYRREIAWSDIERLGIYEDRTFDGYDHPFVQAVYRGRQPKNRPPCVGIRLKPGSKGLSSQRVVYGFDVMLGQSFGLSAAQLLDDLQRRLDRAREVALSPDQRGCLADA